MMRLFIISLVVMGALGCTHNTTGISELSRIAIQEDSVIFQSRPNDPWVMNDLEVVMIVNRSQLALYSLKTGKLKYRLLVESIYPERAIFDNFQKHFPQRQYSHYTEELIKDPMFPKTPYEVSGYGYDFLTKKFFAAVGIVTKYRGKLLYQGDSTEAIYYGKGTFFILADAKLNMESATPFFYETPNDDFIPALSSEVLFKNGKIITPDIVGPESIAKYPIDKIPLFCAADVSTGQVEYLKNSYLPEDKPKDGSALYFHPHFEEDLASTRHRIFNINTGETVFQMPTPDALAYFHFDKKKDWLLYQAYHKDSVTNTTTGIVTLMNWSNKTKTFEMNLPPGSSRISCYKNNFVTISCQGEKYEFITYEIK